MPKVLIIRFSSIGDIVLTTPIIRCVKNQLPGAEIHFLTKRSFAKVIEGNPYIDKVWFFENVSETRSELKKLGFDYVIDLQKNIKSRLIGYFLTGKYLSFDKLNVQKFLLTSFKINTLPDKHIVDRYLECVKPLGIKYDGKGLDFFINNEELKQPNIDKLPKDFNVLILGATHFTKRIPIAKCQQIIDTSPLPVVLLGGKDVIDISDELSQKNDNKTINLCGQMSLGGSAAVIKLSNLVITADTGMMHIAAAFDKNIHVLWGNTIPDFGMYPFLSDTAKTPYTSHQVQGLSCQPCSKLGFDTCPKGHHKCMVEQDVERVFGYH